MAAKSNALSDDVISSASGGMLVNNKDGTVSLYGDGYKKELQGVYTYDQVKDGTVKRTADSLGTSLKLSDKAPGAGNPGDDIMDIINKQNAKKQN